MERPAPHLEPLVHEVLLEVRPRQAPAAPPRVTFYSYVDTTCTVRDRDGRLHFRLSDHLQGAPDDALRGIVGILACRLWRLPEDRVPRERRDAYDRYVHNETSQGRRTRSRQTRGRKHIEPVGRHRSLLASYLRVTMEMDLLLPVAPTLSWTKHVSRRRFGHWDADHNAIVISQALDAPRVPEFVLDYVVYHELLHIVHPPEPGNGRRRRVHTPAFLEAEARFPRRAEAEAWLRRLAR